jgi:hypothetical protein
MKEPAFPVFGRGVVAVLTLVPLVEFPVVPVEPTEGLGRRPRAAKRETRLSRSEADSSLSKNLFLRGYGTAVS